MVDSKFAPDLKPCDTREQSSDLLEFLRLAALGEAEATALIAGELMRSTRKTLIV
jgi:hypothetical protein